MSRSGYSDGPGAWDANPWVAVVMFDVAQKAAR